MFSGIVKEVGTVEKLESKRGVLALTISCSKVVRDLEVGGSVAIDGCCQTVVEVNSNKFLVQSTQETLDKTNFKNLKIRSKVNLEPSLKVGDKLDGHLVLGHIDTAGEIKDVLSYDENKIIKISFSKSFAPYIAPKGSISVNGVSLTVIDTGNNEFSFTLIPFTRDNTNLGLLKPGDLVNLEVDLVSRYLVNYLNNNLQLVRK